MYTVRERLRVRSIPRQAVTIAVALTLAALALALCGPRAAGVQETPQQPRYVERVEVSRVIVDVRVLDNRNNPIVDLSLEDFAVRIDGKTARVESARWVGEHEPRTVPGERAIDTPALPVDSTSPGRLIIFLIQKSMEGHRIWGLMTMLIQARSFLDRLTPDDRVAILSFDSHLKIWTDFTNDADRLRHVLKRGILMEEPRPIQEPTSAQASPGSISLVGRLPQSRGEKTYNIEKGLRLIAEALEPLPGSKAIVLLGHGFGQFVPGIRGELTTSRVDMENGYDESERALTASRTSVFSLDVTKADYHSLELGLQRVSDETGGFYARTHIHPEVAMKKLAGALAGYYVLIVEKPEGAPRTGRIDVELTRRKGDVYARSTF
jgi:VWFA-related protein